MNIIEYPILDTPRHLLSIKREEWDAKQAREYREWLLGNMDARIGYLVRLIGQPLVGAPSENLLLVGAKASPLFRGPFSEAGWFTHPLTNETWPQRELTLQGIALGTDIGLLTAKCLMEELPHLKWETVRRAKKDISYNLPVLKGLAGLNFDPVATSVSIAEGVANQKRGPERWKQIFEMRLEDGRRSAPPN